MTRDEKIQALINHPATPPAEREAARLALARLAPAPRPKASPRPKADPYGRYARPESERYWYA